MNLDFSDISKYIDIKKVKTNELMSNHTTFKIGGAADILCLPETIEDISSCVRYAKEKNIPITIIGNGSKLLVLDGGIRGMVIKIGPKFANVIVNGDEIVVTAGVTLPYLANVAKQHSLSGLEFACGIPATVGGAIFQNAGAYNGEMANVIEEVTYLETDTLNMVIKNVNELEFGYRESFFKKNKEKGYIILSAKMKLVHEDEEKIINLMKENASKRKEKQPLEYPSAGSVFKRPEGYFVGKLIDDAGLKGARIGKAEVSKKHSGFIVNLGNAKAKDVVKLINVIKEKVRDKFSVELNEEIIIIGEE